MDDKPQRLALRSISDAIARGRARRWEVPHPEQATELLGEPPAPQLPEDRLRVLVWNVYKGKRRSWAPRFRELAAGRDLILAQELYFERRTQALLDESELQWATATSFVYPRRGGVGTGLGTAARAASLQVRALPSAGREPITRTPKLALLTEYRLRDELLRVVNVHAINFAGFASFDEQLARIEAALHDHAGPLLVAGDFNTWTNRRRRRLESLMHAAALEPVEFAVDPRATALDHAFVRQLAVDSGEIHRSRASDHAALSFELSLAAPE